MGKEIEVIKSQDKPQKIKGFTDTEVKLLEVLVDPDNIGLTTVDKCKKAGIARDSYYRIMKKPYFVEKMNEAILAGVKARSAAVVEACFNNAISGKNNYHDRRMLLSMAGLYTEGKETLINGNVNTVDFSGMSTEELMKMMDELKR